MFDVIHCYSKQMRRNGFSRKDGLVFDILSLWVLCSIRDRMHNKKLDQSQAYVCKHH